MDVRITQDSGDGVCVWAKIVALSISCGSLVSVIIPQDILCKWAVTGALTKNLAAEIEFDLFGIVYLLC